MQLHAVPDLEAAGEEASTNVGEEDRRAAGKTVALAWMATLATPQRKPQTCAADVLFVPTTLAQRAMELCPLSMVVCCARSEHDDASSAGEQRGKEPREQNTQAVEGSNAYCDRVVTSCEAAHMDTEIQLLEESAYRERMQRGVANETRWSAALALRVATGLLLAQRGKGPLNPTAQRVVVDWIFDCVDVRERLPSLLAHSRLGAALVEHALVEKCMRRVEQSTLAEAQARRTESTGFAADGSDGDGATTPAEEGEGALVSGVCEDVVAKAGEQGACVDTTSRLPPFTFPISPIHYLTNY